MSDLSSTIDRMINDATATKEGSTSSSSSSSQANFIPFTKWNGPVKGYYFGTSKEGTGYHLDLYQQLHQAKNGKKRTREIEATNGTHEDKSSKRKVRFGQDEIQTFVKDETEETQKSLAPSVSMTAEELLEQAEEEQKAKSTKTLDLSRGASSSIKSTILNLEKAISKNQLLRVKYPTQPSKFMNSEVALYEEVELWNGLAASIEHYTLFVETGAVESLKSLLIHDNVDIVLCVIKLFNELLDPELLASDDTNVNLIGEQLCTLMMSFLGWEKNIGEGNLINDDVDHTNDTITNGANHHNNGLDMAIASLARLNESEDEELKGVDDILTLVENLLDLDQLGVLKIAASSTTDDEVDSMNSKKEPRTKTIASHLTENTSFTTYLLMKLSDRNKLEHWSVTNKLHASEVLASIIQHEDSRVSLSNICKMTPFKSMFDDDDKNKKQSTFDGMEGLLQIVAMYRKKEPPSDEECEYLENICNSLSASLLNEENVDAFLEGQGVELMLRCINEGVHSGYCTMKILSFCLSGSSSTFKRAAGIFVDAGGLKSIFPIFMGRKSAMPKPAQCSDAGNINLIQKYATLQKENRRKDKSEQRKPSKRMKQVLAANREWFQSLESLSIQILYGLTRHLDHSSPHDAELRLASKFVENDCEKCDRLVELCLKYDVKMRQAEYDYFKSDEAEEAEDSGVDIDIAAMNAKLKGGGDEFHRLASIIGFAATGSKRAHEHILEQLKMQNSGIATIKEAITEFASLINENDAQHSRVMNYLSAI
jgi:beta-catenin-like protein 1